MLRDWVESRGTPITIRLVKGAYWDYEVLTARRLGWPVPVFLQKWQSDAMFERCTRFLMEHHEKLRPAFGSHNIRSLAHAIAAAEAAGRAPGRLRAPDAVRHGRRRSRTRWSARGHRVRVYTPYGAMLPGMAYLVRRLLENTSNESFLKASFTEHARDRGPAAQSRGDRSHVEHGSDAADELRGRPGQPELPPFRNEPVTDFARAENRQAMRTGHRGRPAEAGADLSAC